MTSFEVLFIALLGIIKCGRIVSYYKNYSNGGSSGSGSSESLMGRGNNYNEEMRSSLNRSNFLSDMFGTVDMEIKNFYIKSAATNLYLSLQSRDRPTFSVYTDKKLFSLIRSKNALNREEKTRFAIAIPDLLKELSVDFEHEEFVSFKSYKNQPKSSFLIEDLGGKGAYLIKTNEGKCLQAESKILFTSPCVQNRLSQVFYFHNAKVADAIETNKMSKSLEGAVEIEDSNKEKALTIGKFNSDALFDRVFNDNKDLYRIEAVGEYFTITESLSNQALDILTSDSLKFTTKQFVLSNKFVFKKLSNGKWNILSAANGECLFIRGDNRLGVHRCENSEREQFLINLVQSTDDRGGMYGNPMQSQSGVNGGSMGEEDAQGSQGGMFMGGSNNFANSGRSNLLGSQGSDENKGGSMSNTTVEGEKEEFILGLDNLFIGKAASIFLGAHPGLVEQSNAAAFTIVNVDGLYQLYSKDLKKYLNVNMESYVKFTDYPANGSFKIEEGSKGFEISFKRSGCLTYEKSTKQFIIKKCAHLSTQTFSKAGIFAKHTGPNNFSNGSFSRTRTVIVKRPPVAKTYVTMRRPRVSGSFYDAYSNGLSR